jgi:DNA-binding NarL/FixJ family response regulator
MINSSVSVLLVEDITGDAQAITRAILYGDIEQYYQVKRAARLTECLEVLSANQIDIILLDLSLPDAKDIKAVVEIRVLFPQTPIIVLSDQSDERIIKRALLNGANSFLPKSQASGVLIRKIIDDTLKTVVKELC